MKKKSLLSVVLTALLVAMLFNGIPVPVKAAWDGTIKIGVVGPMAWTQGFGLVQGANLAAVQINTNATSPGIQIGGKNYKVVIVTADTLMGMRVPDRLTGEAAASALVAAGCDFVIGGFKAEAIYGIRKVLMDYKKIYFITGGLLGGAALNELVWDPTKTDNIYDNYARYKYTFRNAPINSTQQFYAILGYLMYYIVPRLRAMFGTPLKTAIISESDVSTDMIHSLLVTYLPLFTGGAVQIVYTARPAPFAKNFAWELAGVNASGAKLLIHLFWTPAGRTFITQWSSMGVKALPVGISEAALEIPIHWWWTGGRCDYETVLAVTGTQTPITPRTRAYWDAYMNMYWSPPIHTSYAAYDAVIQIEQVLEANAVDWATTTSDTMVPWFEQSVRDGSANAWDYNLGIMAPNIGLTGKFKYTGVGGTHHDVYSKGGDNMGPTWTYGWTRYLVCQWQGTWYNGSRGYIPRANPMLEVVFPLDKTYSTKTKITPWMYVRPETDLEPDISRSINLADMNVIAMTWNSYPGHSNWITGGTFLGLLADMNYDKYIDELDASIVGDDFGKYAGPL